MSLLHRHYLAPLFEPRSVLLLADHDALTPKDAIGLSAAQIWLYPDACSR